MMSGMFVIWLIFIIIVVSKSKGSLRAGRTWTTPLPPEQPHTPDEIARDRYTRGEIGWPEYQEMLVNLLKDRYVRGELELDEYEQRASLVLEASLPVRDEASAQLQAPNTAERSQPGGLEAAASPEVVPTEPAPSVNSVPEAAAPSTSVAPEGTADSAQTRQVHTDSALDTLRRRFLSGELTPEEYEEQCRRLIAA